MNEIFGERFNGERRSVLSNIGVSLKKPVKPSIAVGRYGLDYKVTVEPLVATVGKRSIPTDRFAIVRHPTAEDKGYRTFGVVRGKYELVQNADIATILDPLAEVWALETIGTTDAGKTVFMSFNTGDKDIEGDPIGGHFLVVDIKDGGTKLKCVYTPIRAWCKNTLTHALQKGTVAISIQHILGAKDQFAARVNLIKNAQKAIEETTTVFRQMAKTRVKPAQVEQMFDRVYPLPRTPDEAALVDWTEADLGALLFQGVAEKMYNYNFYTKRQQDLRAGALELYERLNDEYPKLAGTVWHAWNAVVESADFRDGGKTPEVSALFGARAREKRVAFTEAMQFVEVR